MIKYCGKELIVHCTDSEANKDLLLLEDNKHSVIRDWFFTKQMFE